MKRKKIKRITLVSFIVIAAVIFLVTVLFMIKFLIVITSFTKKVNDEKNSSEQTIKINVDNIGMEMGRNSTVASSGDDYVYYSEHGIYLNDEYVQGFEDDAKIGNIALDAKYIYYVETIKEIPSLISVDRKSGSEEVLLSSENLSIIKFEEEILVKYGEKANEIARIEEGKLVELGAINIDFKSSEKDYFVKELKLDNYKFVYVKREFESEARLYYVEKDDERINYYIGGMDIIVNEDGLYSTNDVPAADVKHIELPNGYKTDQSQLYWDKNELYIVSVYGTGPEKVNYSYDRKKSESLFRYDFKTGSLTQLVSTKPSEGQIIGLSVEKEKVYILTENKVSEMSFTGENKKELGEIPVVEGVYVEMCGDRLFVFSKDDGCKLIEIFDI